MIDNEQIKNGPDKSLFKIVSQFDLLGHSFKWFSLWSTAIGIHLLWHKAIGYLKKKNAINDSHEKINRDRCKNDIKKNLWQIFTIFQAINQQKCWDGFAGDMMCSFEGMTNLRIQTNQNVLEKDQPRSRQKVEVPSL